ncbi:uncharacterized protein LOC110466396 [Mizuhopecten yessoensis]|uniref:Uncharacterized protein n=1 Tax=Mizuhopecten yessoensis TaxID=6573 RepID=A0A210PPF3_MIZYE|nr:uncharacterized protein LOC110466396 [Mizuhopecten yessoensis]OWF38326.1 hypothetical protein KP79_PYT17251 [Mizuhopecten yessoensis]
MLVKVWFGLSVTLLMGLIWVAGQGPTDPLEVQIQATQVRNYQLVIEQQRRLSGWRQYYVNRLPYQFLIPIYFLVLLLFRTSTTTNTEEVCPSLPTATTLGVFCCGSFTSQATCQAVPQNTQCTWDTGTCKYECTTFSDAATCTGVGCTWTPLGTTGICS